MSNICSNGCGLPQLDGHWVQEVLVYLSKHFPHELADFFFQRVELGHGRDVQYDQLNDTAPCHVKLKFAESSEAGAVLQKTWGWLRQNDHRGIYFRHHAADLFEAMFLSGNADMSFMFELF